MRLMALRPTVRWLPSLEQDEMRAVRLQEHGGPGVLRVEEIDRPRPGYGELLVEVAATGVNPVDTYFRDGSYTPVGLPFTPGVDFAGTVVEVGEGVTEFEAGDSVFGTGIGNGEHQGAYAEYTVAPADRTVALPAGVDVITAGAAGVVAGTAWRALIDHGRLGPAADCLIHGGSGGVGHAAVQIAAATGARVVTTASEAYHDTLTALGADVVVDYRCEDLADATTEASDGGFDVILDHRLDDYLQFDADIAATHARVVGIGQNSPDPCFSDIAAVRAKDVSYHFMSLFNTPDFRDVLEGVAYLLSVADLEIVIHTEHSLEEAGEGQRAVMEESFLGKRVIIP